MKLIVVLLIIYFLSRIIVSYASRTVAKTDSRKMFSLILLCAELVTVMVIFSQIMINPLKWKIMENFLCFAIGINLSLIGVLLSVIGRFTLWENWNTARNFSLPKEIIKKGIYAFIRHPIYLGTWLTGIGFEMAMQSILIIPAFLFGLILICLLSFEEERMLTNFFGRKYRDYKIKTKMFIPKIF